MKGLNAIFYKKFYCYFFYFQFYAFFDTIKERFGTISSENSIYDSNFFDSIGNLVLGMTGDDIENLPEDTELLTIIEILSDFEDEMDSSQVRIFLCIHTSVCIKL